MLDSNVLLLLWLVLLYSTHSLSWIQTLPPFADLTQLILNNIFNKFENIYAIKVAIIQTIILLFNIEKHLEIYEIYIHLLDFFCIKKMIF